MFDADIINGLTTAGAFVSYHGTLAFMIGPDRSGEKLGIVRLGGHIEGDESCLQALEREIKEEASVAIRLVDAPVTYYKRRWGDEGCREITGGVPLDVQPLVIAGNRTRSTAVFLAYADELPRPASEAYGIIFLMESDIMDICTKKMCLGGFIKRGGTVIQRITLDPGMEMQAGAYLMFLNTLLEEDNDWVHQYICGNL